MRFAVKLCLDLVPGTARSVGGPIGGFAVRIATLNHEPWDHAVKSRAIVEAFLGQLGKVLHMARCDIMKEFEDNVAECLSFTRDGNGGLGLFGYISHSFVPFSQLVAPSAGLPWTTGTR